MVRRRRPQGGPDFEDAARWLRSAVMRLHDDPERADRAAEEFRRRLDPATVTDLDDARRRREP